MIESSSRVRTVWRVLHAFTIAAAATWCFWPAQHGGWLWDDDLEVANNPLLRDPAGWWKAWVAPAGMDYFPLKDTLHWLQWRMWGDAVVGYHLTSLALHILSAWLLWQVLAKLGARHAWLGGLLFAIHPIAVESVAWIAEFKNTASLPLALLAMSAYVDYDSIGRRRDRWCALAWFAAAMLCKSTVAMLPCALLLFAWWRHGRIRPGDLRRTAPFFGVSLVLGLVTLWFQGHRAMGGTTVAAGFSTRLGQAGWNSLAYLRDCVFPHALAPVYEPGRTAVPALVAWLVIGFVLLLGWLRRAAWGRHALLGGGWFLLNLAPVLGIIPMSYLRVSPRADHLVYLSLVGVVGLIGAGFGTAWDSNRGPARIRRPILAALGLAAIVALALTSRDYAAFFRSDEALWREAVVRSPDAWLARNNLGRALLREGRAAEALAQFDQAVRLGPDSAEVRTNRGDALEQTGRTADAQAEYQAAAKLDPRFAGARYNLGRALLQSGHPAEAAAELRVAVGLDAGYAAAHNNLGLALARLGQWPEAMAEYREALRLKPELPEAHLNLGNACFRLNRIEEAIAEYRRALDQNPRFGAAHRNLAVALHALGRDDEARAEFSAAANEDRR